MTVKVAIYARYSSENQRQQSIQDQIRVCKGLAKREGYSVDEDHIYWDEARSGSIRSRPGLDQLIKACEGKAFQMVMVDDLSRLSRNNHHMLTLYAQFQYWEIDLVAVADGLNSRDEQSKLSIQMRGIINELYLDDLKKKTHRGQMGQKLRGFVVGENTYGYRHKPVGELKADRRGKVRPDGYIAVIVAEEAEIVRRIVDLFVQGKAVSAIAAGLNQDKIPTHKRLRGGWNTSTVSRILKNRKYIGEWAWNKKRTVRDPLTGKKRQVVRPESEWIIQEKEDLRIIPTDIWQAAEQRWKEIDGTWPSKKKGRGFNKQQKSYAVTHPPHLLAGSLKCGICSGAVVQISGKGSGYYGCHNTKKKSCDNNVKISRSKLEKAVLAKLQQNILQPERIHQVFETVEKELLKQRSNIPEELKLKQAALDKIQDKINNFVRFVSEGRGSKAITNALNETEKAEEEIEAQIKALEMGQEETYKTPPLEWITHRLEDIQKILELNTKDSALLLRKLFGEIILNPVYPDIGKPYYSLKVNLNSAAILPDCSKSAISLRWRRERDSNPRWVAPQRFSRPPPSATRPSLHICEVGIIHVIYCQSNSQFKPLEACYCRGAASLLSLLSTATAVPGGRIGGGWLRRSAIFCTIRATSWASSSAGSQMAPTIPPAWEASRRRSTLL
jgi:site-specific DNA recombinase